MENYVEFHNLKDAKLCQELESAQESDFVFCNFTSMAVLPIVCQVIVGDVIIDANDGQYLKKLMYISYIFGTLKVQYTKADGLEFLTGLEYIVSLDGKIISLIIKYRLKPINFRRKSSNYYTLQQVSQRCQTTIYQGILTNWTI